MTLRSDRCGGLTAEHAARVVGGREPTLSSWRIAAVVFRSASAMQLPPTTSRRSLAQVREAGTVAFPVLAVERFDVDVFEGPGV